MLKNKQNVFLIRQGQGLRPVAQSQEHEYEYGFHRILVSPELAHFFYVYFFCHHPLVFRYFVGSTDTSPRVTLYIKMRQKYNIFF